MGTPKQPQLRAQYPYLFDDLPAEAFKGIFGDPRQGKRTPSGFPPERHPRRCQWIYGSGYKVGTRCQWWALKGVIYCRQHGGRKLQAAAGLKVKSADPRHASQLGTSLHGVHVFYSKVLGKTLHDKLKEIVESPGHEQFNLREEIALTKISAGDTVQLYDGVCTLLEVEGDEKKRQALAEAKLITGAQMRGVLGEVIDMCDKAARVEAAGKDKVTVQNIVIIVNQIVRVAYETFGINNLDLCYEFERRIKEQVRLPNEGPEGTTITPDQDVLDMDDTIPGRPTDEDENDDSVDAVESVPAVAE